MTSQTPRPRGEVTPVHPADDEISLWEVLAVLLRRRGTIVLTAVLAIAAAVAYTLLREPTYTTQASFRPHGTESSSSQLTALASQFGVNVSGSVEEASPAFYAELLRSREILARIAGKTFQLEGGAPTELAELLEIDEEEPALRLRDTIEKLRESVLSVETGRETGVVTLEVTTKWPELSRDIAERLLDEIARFNLSTRQSQAAAERAFIEERVDSARDALLEAEAAMQAFLQANRRIDDSPDLLFQRDRLERDISLRQQVYTRLVQAFEEARIAEVRDTPVITLLQPPFLPPPDDRRLLLVIALATVLGGMAGVVLAFVVEAVQRPVDDPAREDFRRTWEGLVRSLGFRRRRAA
ncbi:MAG TPA: Wzz/FepE/Etk N-terminal domain-containing protein [Longimicrobiales bacterium]|nr:Wzz/FepE/Etk N-terminal domain-containing protein [Longimicrobiales bacterium]